MQLRTTLLVSEIFKKLDQIEDRERKIEFLRENYTETLKRVLQGIFSTDIQWFRDRLPDHFKSEPAPSADLATGNLHMLKNDFFVWLKNTDHTESVKLRHLTRKLEGIHIDECYVIEAMLSKNPARYKSLTKDLIEEAFPNIL